MRALSTLLLLTSALSLAACGGGGGSIKASGISSGVGSDCPITPVDSTPDCPTDEGGGGGGTTTPPDDDGDGIPNEEETDEDGNSGSGAGGNTTSLFKANKAIVLKGFIYDDPTAGSALATLTAPGQTTSDGVTEAILSANKPLTLTHKVDTKSGINSEISVPVAQAQYNTGTRNLDWIRLKQYNDSFELGKIKLTDTGQQLGYLGQELVSYNGYPVLDLEGGGSSGSLNSKVAFDSKTQTYKVINLDKLKDDRRKQLAEWRSSDDYDPTAPLPPFPPVTFKSPVDASKNFYWDQIKGLMDQRANGGTGQDYREYRILQTAESGNRDELLQVWAFKDSYATQYQNKIGGGTPKHQVWSFGGRQAENVRTGGTATYNGRWVGTAKAEGWDNQKGEINPNVLWRVQGNSKFDLDFGTGGVDGELQAETWTSFQKDNKVYDWTTSAANGNQTQSTATPAEPEFYFYESKIKITGNMDAAATPGGVQNTFTGQANLDGAFISTDENPAYGGLFGTNGTELTGVFNTSGAYPEPQGGSSGVNDNKTATITINGAFNGNCQVDGTGNCVQP